MASSQEHNLIDLAQTTSVPGSPGSTSMASTIVASSHPEPGPAVQVDAFGTIPTAFTTSAQTGSQNTQFPSALTDNSSSTNVIKLLVGEERFTVSANILVSSHYLSRLLLSISSTGSSNINIAIPDADGTAFSHVLRYLRTKTYPLFWTSSAGFNYANYASVLASAEFFGVTALASWITQQKYFEAVKVEYTTETRKDEPTTDLVAGNVEKSYTTHTYLDKVYQCPRGVNIHKGQPDRCGQQCRDARGTRPVEYVETLVKSVTVVTKRVVVDYAVLRE